jgi:putative DNA primase/helicase
MKTLEAIRGRENLVLDLFGLAITGNRHIDCGICESKRSLRITLYRGELRYICKCGNGSILKYVTESTGRAFKDVAGQVDRVVQNTFTLDKPKTSLADKFKRMDQLKGTDGEKYLLKRGIRVLPTSGVRFNDSTIVSVASDNNHKAVYVHKTFLDGDKKAQGTSRKLYKVGEGDCSIKMFPLTETLGVAEGIETALSVKQLYKCSCWSTLNTSLMKRFKAPKGVTHLMVFADSDKNGAGHAAAFECANKNMLANNDVERVTVRWPERGDFNDVLQEAHKVYEWRLQ